MSFFCHILKEKLYMKIRLPIFNTKQEDKGLLLYFKIRKIYNFNNIYFIIFINV
jgi:hypothetical protein